MSRETIIQAIRKHKPGLVSLPDIQLDRLEENTDLLTSFRHHVNQAGGRAVEVSGTDTVDSVIRKLYPEAKRVISCCKDSKSGNVFLEDGQKAHELESLDLAIIEGQFGVAENAAVWVSESEFPLRVLPFITKDLVLVLNKKDLCANMHRAYQKLQQRHRGFGLFISGPSKTADIEQSLVIGAQGAMSLTVLLL